MMGGKRGGERERWNERRKRDREKFCMYLTK
jgi:hypothetical protein